MLYFAKLCHRRQGIENDVLLAREPTIVGTFPSNPPEDLRRDNQIRPAQA